MLALYRLGTHIPAPGINSAAVNQISSSLGGNSILGLLNLFSGGGLGRIALFALGIMPYITASIILQILQVALPRWRSCPRRARSASSGSPSTRATSPSASRSPSRSATCSCSAPSRAQAGVTLINNFNLGKVFLIVISLTAGTMLLMWLGELITQRGIGNGISLLIFASIVSRIPGRHQLVVAEPGSDLQGDHAVHRRRRRSPRSSSSRRASARSRSSTPSA